MEVEDEDGAGEEGADGEAGQLGGGCGGVGGRGVCVCTVVDRGPLRAVVNGTAGGAWDRSEARPAEANKSRERRKEGGG